jgi:hypothetical protein
MLEEPRIIDGRYEIIEKLGEGAFGPTYLVRNTLFDTRAVLKLRRHADPDLASRLRREVVAFGKIDHPNVARVTDTGMTADGTPYLVMQYVAGSGLDTLLRRGALRLQDAVHATTALASGLQALHERGLVHRDVKPSNIIIPGEGVPRFERATLIDFGVFGELASSGRGQQLTQAGEVFGTPAYMSPEQVRGQQQSVAADVYSLGLVLYEMLVPDRPLFPGTGLEILVARVSGDITIANDLPLIPAVKDLIEGMLRAEPDRRLTLAQVQAVLRDLERTDQAPGPSAPRRPASPNVWRPDPHVSSPRDNLVTLAVAGGGLAIIAIIAGRSAVGTVVPRGALAVVSGLAIAGAGYLVARLTRALAAARRPAIENEATEVMLGTQSREALTATLAIQVDHLVQRCRAMGEAYWGQTVALMLKEYEDARDAKDRREALMNVATLIEKVTAKLSPWYVRHDKALAATLTAVGILGGLWKIAFDIVNLSRAKP